MTCAIPGEWIQNRITSRNMTLVLVYLSDKILQLHVGRTVNIFIKYKNLPQISKNIHVLSVVAIELVSRLITFHNKF